MGIPAYLIPSIQRVGKAQKEFLGDTYGNLAEGPVHRKIIPIYQRIDAINRTSPTGIACKEGCSFCCHYHVYVTPMEVFAIAEHIRSLPKSRQRATHVAIKNYVQTVQDWGSARHITTNIACSFLSAGRCSIYPLRPLACRRHHSKDRDVCERTFIDPQLTENAPMDAHRIVTSGAFETLHATYHAFQGLDRDVYEFQAAMLEALTDSRCRQRWNTGKRAFLKVRDRQAPAI